MKTEYYIIFVWGDIEPQVKGPFGNREQRDATIKELRKIKGEEHGYFWLNIVDGKPEAGAYPGRFFEEED